MSAVRKHQRDEQMVNDSDVAHSGVTPVMPASGWLRELDTDPAPSGGAEEDEFWNTPPRYSITDLASLAPAPIAVPPSRKHTWSARLLFGAISCGVIALLVLELTSLGEGAPSTSTSSMPAFASP